jgi:hypothetical protein
MASIARTLRNQWIGVICLCALIGAATGGSLVLGRLNTADATTTLQRTTRAPLSRSA